jgi:hypothetical protein
METVLRRGLTTLQMVNRCAPHASPSDTSVEEKRPVMMSKKMHDRVKKLEKLPKKSNQLDYDTMQRYG